MTTTVTHSIKNDGSKDYSLLSTWWSNCPSSLTSADQIWKGEVYDELVYPLAATTFSGVTADASRYPWLAPAAGCGLRDDPSAPLRYTSGKAGMAGNPGYAQCFIDVANPYMRVEGLQFATSSGGVSPCVRLSTTNVRCIGLFVETTFASFGIHANASDAIIANNVVVCRATGSRAIYCNGNYNPTIVGNTLYSQSGADYGISASAGYVTPFCLNNAIFGFTVAMSGTNGFGASDYNCTDYTSLGGSGTHQKPNTSLLPQFRDVSSYASLDLRPATSGSDIAGAGTNPSVYVGNNLDFYGASRASPPTIGAAEIAAQAYVPWIGLRYLNTLVRM